jgi:hypothetical protein
MSTSTRSFVCSSCGKQWPENYCPECAGTIERAVASPVRIQPLMPSWLRYYAIPFSWIWASLVVTSGLLGAVIGGWTLLHCYTPLFYFAIGVFCASVLLVPVLLIVGAWSWLSGRASLRVFLFHFLAPQFLAVAGFLIAYVAERLQSQGAA